jgi:hypothetical protein
MSIARSMAATVHRSFADSELVPAAGGDIVSPQAFDQSNKIVF